MLAVYRRSMMEQTPQHVRLKRRPMTTPGSVQKTPGSATTPSAYEQDSFCTEGEHNTGLLVGLGGACWLWHHVRVYPVTPAHGRQVPSMFQMVVGLLVQVTDRGPTSSLNAWSLLAQALT